MEIKLKKTGNKKVLHSFHKQRVRSCNICGKSFKAKRSQQLFCGSCKSSSELYMYSEWLPQFALNA